MIVVDGRTDIEKLKELLATGTECSALDFKESLNLGSKRDKFDFIKDAVAIFNRYPGGYIIIGATNEGAPSDLCEGIDWQQFDGARLTDKIRNYVDAPLTLISALHEIDGHTYCLVCMMSLPDGLPSPFTKLGQWFDEQGKPHIVFRPGDIVRRDGAQNRSIEYLQWAEILERHDALVREDESKRINSLIDKITVALGEKGKTPPLVYGMDDAALSAALTACFEQEETAKLTRFVNQLSLEIEHSDDAIENLTSVATYAISYGFDEIARKAIDALYDFYMVMNHFGTNADDKLFAIAVATYEIGASMVLGNRWDMISPFVNRQSPHNPNYVYASWIRECQVRAVNAGRFRNDTSTMMISVALDHIKRHASIIPEYSFTNDTAEGHGGTLTEEDESVLNLLCSFDFLYCLCVFVAGEGQAGAYPACVGYEQQRISYVVIKMFGKDDSARRALLPGYSDEKIAEGMRELYRLMSNEAWGSSKFVWELDLTGLIGPFLQANATDES